MWKQVNKAWFTYGFLNILFLTFIVAFCPYALTRLVWMIVHYGYFEWWNCEDFFYYSFQSLKKIKDILLLLQNSFL